MPDQALTMVQSPFISPSAWRWALVQTRRDLRASAMRFLLLAVVLAVAALTAVAFFADRIERGLSRDAAQLLGADTVAVADQPLPDELPALAHRLKLRQTQTAVFPSMARAPDEQGGDTRLVALKAVGLDYPLRGHLTLGEPDEQGGWRVTRQGPAGGPPPGRVWVDKGVLESLKLKLGDGLWLGDARFIIDAAIVAEPDRGGGFVSFSPRAMIRSADLPATQLVQPASRITYRLLVAGSARVGDAVPSASPPAASPPADAARVAAADAGQAMLSFSQAAQKLSQTQRGLRVENLDQGRPEMRATLDRAGLFLRLVALLAALLSAVAVALVARDFAQRRLDDCALMRVLGVSQRTMAWTYGLQFAAVGLLGSGLGLILGWLFHQVFVFMLSDLVGVELPPPGWQPLALGLGVGSLLTLGFGLPPVLQLAQVPPLRVLRRDLGGLKASSTAVWGLGSVALLTMLMLVARDVKLGAIALGGFAGAMLVFALLSYLAVTALRHVASRLSGRAPVWWTLATRQLTAQPAQTVVQVCALGLGLLALMLLVLIRTDLVSSWRAATPSDAPNRFIINIQPDQVEAFQATLREAGVSRFDWYPMARGRLVAVNGQPIGPQNYPDERAQRLVDREFNLSHAASAPNYNPIVKGRFVPDEPDAFSVEEGLAKTLNLKLGDRLRFDMAGTPQEGRITSLRTVHAGQFLRHGPLSADASVAHHLHHLVQIATRRHARPHLGSALPQRHRGRCLCHAGAVAGRAHPGDRRGGVLVSVHLGRRLDRAHGGPDDLA
jgi:putative ABC transport system permease protein